MTPWPLAILLATACGRIGFDGSGSDAVGTEPRSDFRSLCAFDKITIIQNGLSIDDSVGNSLQTNLKSGCGNTPIVRMVSQDDPGILDPVTGRPLIDAAELAIIGGGEGPNRAIRYLLDADTPVVWSGTSTATIRERATDRLLVEGPVSATRDFVMVMVIVEPIGGVHVLSGQGFLTVGTVASGVWFAKDVAPTIATNTDVWTLIDWNDASGDGVSPDDSFVVLESGR